MSEYLLTPKAPLVFRDGKPFGTNDNQADTLPFPLPSTVAGAIRTAWAESQPAFDYNNPANIKSLLNKRVAGPLLLQTDATSGTQEICFPAPADSTCIKSVADDKDWVHRLYPKSNNSTLDEGSDLPDGLLPVMLMQPVKGKVSSTAPRYWKHHALTEWLSSKTSEPTAAAPMGPLGLPQEVRTHVAIAPDHATSLQGHLFQTAGLDFGRSQRVSKHPDGSHKHSGWNNTEYQLVSYFSEDLPATARTLGGEARLIQIERKAGLWPSCHPSLKAALLQRKSFRMVLATPAIFTNGYLPSWLNPQTLEGKLGKCPLTVKLRAAAIPRWQAGISWDMTASDSKKGKGMRGVQRLVPAGAVYWFDIIEGDSASLIDCWLISISDERANDGYGLILPGIWQ
jgi:CRISPR-associated protein Cmr3